MSRAWAQHGARAKRVPTFLIVSRSGRAPSCLSPRLYLVIEAESQANVKAAKKELKRILEEASVASAPDDSSTNRYAKYTV